jgi:hypothetical protein
MEAGKADPSPAEFDAPLPRPTNTAAGTTLPTAQQARYRDSHFDIAPFSESERRCGQVNNAAEGRRS